MLLCATVYRGIYDSGVTAFALSEVISLSSSLTVGMNRADDNYILHLLDRMISNLKLLPGCNKI